MDGLRKLALGELATALASEGTAVALITHDIDFAAEAAQAVTTMAHGRVLADRAPRSALAGGLFFAGQVALATGHVSVAEAADALRAGDGGDPCLAWCWSWPSAASCWAWPGSSAARTAARSWR